MRSIDAGRPMMNFDEPVRAMEWNTEITENLIENRTIRVRQCFSHWSKKIVASQHMTLTSLRAPGIQL